MKPDGSIGPGSAPITSTYEVSPCMTVLIDLVADGAKADAPTRARARKVARIIVCVFWNNLENQ